MIEAVTRIIVEEGASAVTHQRVAERAGIGRATVYRHWPTSDDILMSVFELFRFPTLVADNGSLEQRLVALLRWIAAQFARPEVRAFLLTVSERAPRDPAVDRVKRERMAEFQRGVTSILSDVGMPLDQPDATLMARLVGPVWFRVLVQGEKADDGFIDGVVKDFIARTDARESPSR
jgi:AcrR family transcriptional regulator